MIRDLIADPAARLRSRKLLAEVFHDVISG